MAQAPSRKSQVITLLESIQGKQAGRVLAFVEDLPEDRFTRTFRDAEQALGYWAQKEGGVCLGCEGVRFGEGTVQVWQGEGAGMASSR